jgi:Fic family protein
VTPFVPKGAIYYDEEDKLRSETRNGVIQAEFIFFTASDPDQRATPELLLKLQELAITQIYRCAGHFRDGPVYLQGAHYEPPNHTEVPRLVEEMCAYINDHWDNLPVHLASYAMWRVNWIHPFYGGNGRSARAFSYLILCLKLGFTPPASDKTVPELIGEDRTPYYAALRKADEAWAAGQLNLTAMEDLISSLLAAQLVHLLERATGKPYIRS